MSLYNGPPRGGSRGGKDQFSWDAVKADKDRECYLGHSVKALTGRWQKGRDVYWYTREKRQDSQIDDELRAVKEREAQLMNEALGLAPKASFMEKKRKLEAHEMQQLLQRGGSGGAAEGGTDAAEPDEALHARGFGYAPRAMGGVAGQEVLPGYDELDNLPPPPPRSGEAGPSSRVERPGEGANGHEDDALHDRKRSKRSEKEKSHKKHKDKDKERKSEKHKKHKHSKSGKSSKHRDTSNSPRRDRS